MNCSIELEDMSINALIIDMQPIDPPIGGGRIRLMGLYHNLGRRINTTYIGTYDWPGENYRDHYLSDTLREINVPLSEQHFAVNDKLKRKSDGVNFIDVLFPRYGHLSKQYILKLKEFIPDSDIVIFSHPWVFPLVRDRLDFNRQYIIYDSQNVESYLRYTLLDDGGGLGTDAVHEVIKVEYDLCHQSHNILVCSHEDREMFNRLFDIPLSKMIVVPNGVFVEKGKPIVNEDSYNHIRKEIGLKKPAIIFLGSNYGPNIEGAHFILDELANTIPDAEFVIAGGVGQDPEIVFKSIEHNNVTVTGFLDEQEKLNYLNAADVAINPMFCGSGTNIKMFDFMAAGLPVVSTDIGARGIVAKSGNGVILSTKSNFQNSIIDLLHKNREHRLSIGLNGRVHVEEKFSWRRISLELGKLIKRKFTIKDKSPYFSVIIPTYERHEKLNILIKLLKNQSFRDFEVIIVDQSNKPWADMNNFQDIDLFYFYTDIKGAVKARNKGAFFASGKVIAFTDDDCEPDINWLKNAYDYFRQNDIIGLEGLIKCPEQENLDDYRIVSNEGLEGLGFMAANLFITSEIFHKINGFDETFDMPHFREDTDLAWRALTYGHIPFAKDVLVIHPPHKRSIKRESEKERNKFFEKDAFLFKKHPEKYFELFIAENNFTNPHFYHYFMKGAKKADIEMPQWMWNHFNKK